MPGDGRSDWKVVEFPKLGGLAGGPLRLIRLGILAILILLLAVATLYTVGPEEVGVVLRFGRFIGTTDPGLHVKIPFVDTVIKVPVQRQLKEEFGYRTVRAGVESQFTTTGYEDESQMLTGDLSSAVVEWVVQYRVVDPYKFLFRVRSVQETLRDMSEAVMREIVGDRTVNEVLTVGRQEVAHLTEGKLQELCDQYETGIKIEQVVLQDVNPPDPVKPSFNEVNEAQQERETLINQAQSEYNKVVPRALGEAQQTIAQAEGYALNRVNRARGEAALFDALYAEYRKAPEVTRKRIYLETLAEVLPEVGRKIIIDEEVRGLVPLLGLEGGRRPPPEGQP